MPEEKKPEAPKQAAEYKLEPNEVKHVQKLIVSRDGVRSRLLDAKQDLEAAKALVKQLTHSVSLQDVQLGSACGAYAANRGEADVMNWIASPDGTSIVRVKQD